MKICPKQKQRNFPFITTIYEKGGSVSYDKMNNVDSNAYRIIERAVRGRDVLLRTKGDKIFVIDERNDKIYEYDNSYNANQRIEDFVDKLKSSYAKGGKIEEMDWDEIEKQLDGLDDTKKATGSLSPKEIMFRDALEQEYDYRKEKGYEDLTYEEIKEYEDEDFEKGGSIDKKIDEVERSIDNETDMERMEELYEELEVLEEEKEQQLSKQKMMFGGTTSMPRGSGWGDYEKGDRVLKKKDLIPGNMYLSYSGQFDAKNVVYIMPLRDGNQFFTDKIFFVYVDPKSKTPKLRNEYDIVVNIDESDLRDNVRNYNFYKIKNHKYKKPSKFDHGGIITSKRDLDLVVGAMMKIAVDNDCTKNDSYWTKERKDRLSSLAVDMLNKHKHMYMKKEYGVGGVLAGALVGGYIGYKYGLIQEQRKLEDLFRTEKKLAKEYKQKYDDRKKKYEEGGSVMNPDTPKIYVADLKAYNEGKLIGEWIDLTDYSDGYEVQEKIDELMSDYSDKYHNGEETEHAIHDYENFDSSLYSEYMGEREYDIIIQTHNVSEDKDIPAEVLQTIMNDFSEAEDNLEEFVDDRYVGEFDNDSEIGEYYVDMVGGIEGVSNPEYYFDYEALGRDLSINDYNEYDNHYFRNYKKGGEIKEYDLSKYAKGGEIKPIEFTTQIGDREFYETYDKPSKDVKYGENEKDLIEEYYGEVLYEDDMGWWIDDDTVVTNVMRKEYAKGGKIYKIQQKSKYDIQPKWEDERFQTGGRKFLTYKQAQDFKKKLQNMSSSIQYKVVEDISKSDYAKGGIITGAGKPGLDKIKKISKDNPSQMYKVTDDNYSNIGNFYLKNGKFAKMTVSNADYDFAYNKLSLRPKRDVIYKATEIEGKGGYYAKGGEIKKGELKKVVSKSFDWYTYKKGRAWTSSDTKKLAEKLSQNIKSLKEFPQVLNRVNIREFIDELEGYSVPKNKGINYVTESLYSYFMKGEGYAKGGMTEKDKLDEAIRHFEDKIKKQGRITNARDEEQLSKLKELRKSFAKGGVIKKGDYVEDYGDIGVVNKTSRGVAYVKFDDNSNFQPVQISELKKKGTHKGKDLYILP